MGANQTPKRLFVLLGQRKISPNHFWTGLGILPVLCSKVSSVEWVILTNGLQFKVLNYANDVDKQKYFKCELDEIIKVGGLIVFLRFIKYFT